MIKGFFVVELEGVPPGNVHSHEVGLPPERSVYCTVKVTQPSVLFEKKSALGGETIPQEPKHPLLGM